MELRRFIKCCKISINVKHLCVFNRLFSCFLFLFFFLGLENVDKAHRTALFGRWSHFSVDSLLIDSARSAPRWLDVADILPARFLDHIAPVERHCFFYRSFRSVIIHRCFDRLCFDLRLLELNIRVCSENRLFRSDDPGSAFAAELSAIHELASTISTEHFIPPYSLLPFYGSFSFFAHQNCACS